MEETKIETQENPGVSRRYFVKGAGLVAGGFAIGSMALVQACTSNNPTTTATTLPPTTTAPPTTTPAAIETYVFFSSIEAATIKAAFGRLIPGTPQDPGAVEAAAHIYIDRSLNGAYTNLQQTYRRGIASMNAYTQSVNSKNFSDVTSVQQDSILTDMQSGKATGFYAPGAAEFFSLLLKHVGEGLFCDPIYGGNLNLSGWKMIGFPGAQHSYGDSDMAIGADQSKKAILTLAEIEAVTMPLPASGF